MQKLKKKQGVSEKNAKQIERETHEGDTIGSTAEDSQIQTCISKVENRNTLKIKSRYYLEK